MFCFPAVLVFLCMIVSNKNYSLLSFKESLINKSDFFIFVFICEKRLFSPLIWAFLCSELKLVQPIFKYRCIEWLVMFIDFFLYCLLQLLLHMGRSSFGLLCVSEESRVGDVVGDNCRSAIFCHLNSGRRHRKLFNQQTACFMHSRNLLDSAGMMTSSMMARINLVVKGG